MKIYLTGSKHKAFAENPSEFMPQSLVYHLFLNCEHYRGGMEERVLEEEKKNIEFTTRYRCCKDCMMLDAIQTYDALFENGKI